MKLFASSLIDAPIADVWDVVRDFGAIHEWLPGVARSEVEAGFGRTEVGAYRRLTFEDGSGMRERLVALNDQSRSVTFAIVESAVPVSDYVATIALAPLTDGGGTFVSWSSEFDVAERDAEAMRSRMLGQIYQPGFDGLKARFERK